MSRFDRSSEMDSVLLQIRELVTNGKVSEGQPPGETRNDAILDASALRALAPKQNVGAPKNGLRARDLETKLLVEKQPIAEPTQQAKAPIMQEPAPTMPNFEEPIETAPKKSKLRGLLDRRKSRKSVDDLDESNLDGSLEHRLGQVFLKPMIDDAPMPAPAADVPQKMNDTALDDRLVPVTELNSEPAPAPLNGFRRFDAEEAKQEAAGDEPQIRRLIPETAPEPEIEAEAEIVPLHEVQPNKVTPLRTDDVAPTDTTLVTNFRDLRNGLGSHDENEPIGQPIREFVPETPVDAPVAGPSAQVEEAVAPAPAAFTTRRKTETHKEPISEQPEPMAANESQEVASAPLELCPSEAVISQEISKLLEAELVEKLGQDVTHAIRLMIREEIIAAREA